MPDESTETTPAAPAPPAAAPSNGADPRKSAFERAAAMLGTTKDKEPEEQKVDEAAAAAEPTDTKDEKPNGKAKAKAKGKERPSKAAKADETKPDAAEADKEPTADAKDAAADEDKEKKAADDRKKAREARMREVEELRRAREWKKNLAKEDREIKRQREALTKERAEFSKVQQELADLNKLADSDPAEFLRRTVAKNGLRPFLERVLKEGKDGEQAGGGVEVERIAKGFQEELAKRDAELAELKKWREEQEEQRKKSEEEREQSTRDQRIRSAIGQSLKAPELRDDYPFTFTHSSEDIQDYVFQMWRERFAQGEDIDLTTALDHIENELEQRFERLSKARPTQTASTPAQDNGAVDSRQTPGAGQLSNSAVAARASGSKPESREERMARAASLLRKT